MPFSVLFVVFLLAVSAGCATPQSKAGSKAVTMAPVRQEKAGPGQITQAELQSEVMGFADGFAAIMFQAFDDFEAQSPPPRARYIALADTVYSVSAAFTIAAEPNPEVALLDMTVMTTLGRMIYEEHWRVEFGDSVEEMVKGFRLLEADVWRIVEKVLPTEGQEELRDLIRQWRQDYPGQLAFSYIRFSDFAAMRRQSTLAKTVASGGVFASVRDATQEVEQTRLLAERGIFLASRLPLLMGAFGDVWLTQWLFNPEIQKVMRDVHTISEVSVRLAAVAEQLPEQIAAERKNLILDLESQESMLRGLTADLRQTMRDGSELISLVNETTQSVESTSVRIDSMLRTPASGRPFDIMDYHNTVLAVSDTLAKVKALLGEYDGLVADADFQKPFPLVVEITDRLGLETQEVITHAFILGAVLILIFFLSLFGYRYAAKRLL
jgi:hypothetical protein